MTNHLRPEEFVDALDRALPARRAAHLEECEACRAELQNLLTMHSDAQTDDVPEPSPLFWDHFSARVQQATARESISRQSPWLSGWRPVAMLTAAASVAALLLVQMRSTPNEPSGVPAPVTTAAELAFEDDGSWDIVLGLASDVAWEDVRDAVAPAAGAADAAIEELTAAQREALVRLLKQEIGE